VARDRRLLAEQAARAQHEHRGEEDPDQHDLQRRAARLRVVCPGDPRGQAVYILDKITASIAALGGSLDDVVRTRIYLANADDWEAVGRAHGRHFAQARPANTLLEVSRLVGDYLVEIDAEAELARD